MDFYLHPRIRSIAWMDFPGVPARGIAPDLERDGVEVVMLDERVLYGLYVESDLTKIYQAWYHIFQQLPPIPNIETLGDSGASGRLALSVHGSVCKGRVRENRDDELWLSSKPAQKIQYFPSMSCVARFVKVEEEEEFWVRLIKKLGRNGNVFGHIMWWGFGMGGSGKG